MVTSEIDWESEQIMVSVGGGQQTTLDNIGKPEDVKKKALAGYAEVRHGLVMLKFLDGTVEMISQSEFKPIEKQWIELQTYQLGRGKPAATK